MSTPPPTPSSPGADRAAPPQPWPQRLAGVVAAAAVCALGTAALVDPSDADEALPSSDDPAPAVDRDRASPAPPEVAPGDVDADLLAAVRGEPEVLDPLAEAAAEQGLEPELVVAVSWHESRWRAEATSPAGAVGPMQVMPRTADIVADELDEPLNPRDPEDNALAGAAYLAMLLDHYGDKRRALIAYNQGPTRLDDKGPFPAAEAFADAVLDTREELRRIDW